MWTSQNQTSFMKLTPPLTEKVWSNSIEKPSQMMHALEQAISTALTSSTTPVHGTLLNAKKTNRPTRVATSQSWVNPSIWWQCWFSCESPSKVSTKTVIISDKRHLCSVYYIKKRYDIEQNSMFHQQTRTCCMRRDNHAPAMTCKQFSVHWKRPVVKTQIAAAVPL